YVASSSSGSALTSRDTPRPSRMRRTMPSIRVRVLSPRKSNLMRPIDSTSVNVYCVTTAPSLSTHSGTWSVSVSGAITMPAACLDALRSRPSSRSARSKSRPSRSPSADLLETGLDLERLGEREVLALPGLGIELRDAIGLGEAEVENAADVLDRLLPLQRAE